MDGERTLCLTKNETVVLKLISMALNEGKQKFANPDTIDWQAVFNELKDQAMAAVPIDIIKEMVPQPVFKNWVLYAERVMVYAENILYYQMEIMDLLDNKNIQAVVLKGASVAYYYPNPLYRNTTDIDILVEMQSFNNALRLMLENGYELVHEIEINGHHAVLKKRGILYELHKEPSGIAQNKKGNTLRQFFRESIKESEECSILGYRFKRFKRLQNGVVILLHIVNHLDYGLGLRQLCDWMVFVKEEMTEDIWNREFAPLLRAVGLEKLAMVCTDICKRYLGLSQNVKWCNCVEAEIGDMLLTHILDSGNFGSKVSDSLNLVDLFAHTAAWSNESSIIRFMKNIQNTGISQWDACQRFKALRCIAWLYALVIYTGRLFLGKRKLIVTKKFKKRLATQRRLHEKLSVYK